MPDRDVELSRVAAAAAREALKGAQTMHQDQLSNIALAAAKEAVRETHAELFALLGVNIADFDDIQRLRGNLEFLQTLRVGSARVGSRITMTLVTAVIGAMLFAFWWGLTHAPWPSYGPQSVSHIK